MAKNIRVKTKHGDTFVGEVRGGMIAIGQLQFTAAKLRKARIHWNLDSAGHPSDGWVELDDGTCIRVPMSVTGILFREARATISGEVLLFVDSIGDVVRIPADDIEWVWLA